MDQDPTELSDIRQFDQLLSAYVLKRFSEHLSGPGASRITAGLLLCAFAVVSLILGMLFLPANSFIIPLFIMLFMPGIFLAVFGAHQNTEPPIGRAEEICRLLSRTQDTRLISRLVDMASGDMAYQRASEAIRKTRPDFPILVTDALIRLLPQIQPEAAQMLYPRQRRWLYDQLLGNNERLIIAILQATLRCGSIQALPYVELLIKTNRAAMRNATVRQLAEACAQQLHDRMERLHSPQILLRASMAPASEELLRPGMVPEAEELLRSGRAPTDLLLPTTRPSDPAPHQLLHPAVATPDPDPRQLLRPTVEEATESERKVQV